MIIAREDLGGGEEIALWGGIECTVNRVGDAYFDQLEWSGHANRAGDLECCATLGIRALRYPVLWERTAPQGLANAHWHWSDARLNRLRELAITPIVGLVHHGSGPAYTNLADPEFAAKLAEYAGAVANRYPWIEHYTPVNEPLTTARFSGWYGLWYPHGRDPQTFIATLLGQCRAIVLAMRAIRSINPRAKLIQTEDLGKTFSTPLLAYQAEFNNELRWLVWDLLCGKLDSQHPLWKWLTRCANANEADLLWFNENQCVPDILGANHYVTSLRFLDEKLQNYPVRFHGGNGRHSYVDIEAARCLLQCPEDTGSLLLEAWQRYRLPLAITECHIDSTRDDQLRWIFQMWRAANTAKNSGADIRAFTIWALFGAYDWNSLVTQSLGYYEPGAFDVRGTRPRPTAVAALVRELASGKVPSHPVVNGPGWWLRSQRFFCPPVDFTCVPAPVMPRATAKKLPCPRPVLITGATGTLGRAFARVCEERGLHFCLLSRADMDIADSQAVDRALAHYQPWGVINAAGYVRVDDAEQDVERCFRENTWGPLYLAAACRRHKLAFLTFSSDLVFNGQQNAPYIESDPVAPLSTYGRSKAEAEKGVLERYPGALVIRTSAFFGPWDEYNYISMALRALRQGSLFPAAGDTVISPTYVPDLVHAALDLLIDNASGIWHLSNGDAVTWAELALRAARASGLNECLVQICRSRDLNFVAPRPSYSVLGSQRAMVMPTLNDALDRLLKCSAAD